MVGPKFIRNLSERRLFMDMVHGQAEESMKNYKKHCPVS